MSVRLGKLQKYKTHPRLDGYSNLIVCSVNNNWGQLSPMKLGPFTVIEDIRNNIIHPGFKDMGNGKQIAVCNNLENYWQYSKVYSVDVVNGVIQQSYFNRRAEGMASIRAKRRVFPKNSNITTVCAYYDGMTFDYLQSRIFYCTYYEYLASNHPKYIEMKRLYDSGAKIILLDYDAPGEDSHNRELTEEYIIREYNDTTHPFSHGMVLCCMLMGIRPWVRK